LEGPIDRRLKKAGKESLLETPSLIELHHGRGRDELVHQALKDPLAERMPFEDFLPNVAFYSGGAQGLYLSRRSWSPISEPEMLALIGPKIPAKMRLRRPLFTGSQPDQPKGLNGGCQSAV